MESDNSDMDVSDMLRELIAFLECLCDAQLPLTLESLREKLLIRSKNMLIVTTARSEPYLDMNAGSKSLSLMKNDSQEYIGMDETEKRAHQDYYETFENESKAVTATKSLPSVTEHAEHNHDRDDGQTFIRIYKNLSAAQTKSKCHKCGPLYKKEGKKLFLSENRACWIALVGSHLLIYRSERHNRPYAIYPIRGYMVRPAPNLIPRDRQKSESAFEMYCPGNETLQFIARTAKEMEQWITKICEVGCGNEGRSVIEAYGGKSAESSISRDNEKQQDIGKSIIADNRISNEGSMNDKNERRKDPIGSPPPLPARIPRRLPSIPSNNSILSREGAIEDDDDDDDIYHRIEDLSKETRYQNTVLSKKHQADIDDKNDKVVDDISKEGEGWQEESSEKVVFEETYDDIVTLSRESAAGKTEGKIRNNDRLVTDNQEEREASYDDVENLTSNERGEKDQLEISNRIVQKKSFLDRVWSRKESPGKLDKRFRDKVSSNTSQFLATEEISTYDDVSDLTPNQELNQIEESPEYNCPPPPRPIYAKTSIINDPTQVEEFYDDVSAYREQRKKNHQQTILKSTQYLCTKTKEDNTIQSYNTGFKTENELPQEKIEHYQSPRSDLHIRDIPEFQQNEVLYDDIALWVDFTARQRNIGEKKDGESMKSVIGPDKKSWNRFTVNRKLRSSDRSVEIGGRSANESEETPEDLLEGHGLAKRNTFQRLISKMENSFAKVSARSPPSLSTSKPNTTSNL